MNKTRKQIIELIEPYIDKTLSEGCYICQKYKGKDITNIYKISAISDNYIQFNIKDFNYSSFDKKDVILGYDEYFEYEIIGHYDITAVLKYIDKSYRDYRGIPQGNILVELTQGDIHINIGEDLYKIPNKPLHLYTKQEEIDLLSLLQTIGQKQ